MTSAPNQKQTGLGPRVYPFTNPGCCTAGSDAGSDVIKPASGFVIQNRQISCSVWCPMYWASYLSLYYLSKYWQAAFKKILKTTNESNKLVSTEHHYLSIAQSISKFILSLKSI